jgi:sulfite oxidase
LALAELKERFEEHSTTATLTCAGNRREELSKIKPVGGVQWGPGAVGNAEWAGVRLSDVLHAARLKENAKHIWFEGLDEITEKNETTRFGGSIPLSKALHDENDIPGALLAFNMNGEPLSVDHGFPLRSVVPGYIGARSVKWLAKITVSDRPSPNHFVQEAYKLVQEDKPLAWDEAGILYNFSVNAAIAGPAPKAHAQTQTVQGYALPQGNGGTIAKVEVSANNGQTWTAAKLLSESKPYCWVLWEASLQVPSGSSRIVVRATDSKGHAQPERPYWNLKGYMNNAWHSLSITS